MNYVSRFAANQIYARQGGIPRIYGDSSGLSDRSLLVEVMLEGCLVSDSLDGGVVPAPRAEALWALRVLSHNGWDIDVVFSQVTLNQAQRWVSQYIPGLVSRIRSVHTGSLFDVDLVIDNRSDYWVRSEWDWVEVMERLHRKGFLPLGLLPREQTMHILDDVNFREYMSDVHADLRTGAETENVIEQIEMYTVATVEVHTSTQDRVQRALAGGKLLHSVLVLMAQQKFDPLGCLLLAQQRDTTL